MVGEETAPPVTVAVATYNRSATLRLALETDALRIAQMPGVTAAFEAPKSSDLVLRTDEISVEESVRRIVELMKAKGFLREPTSRG